MPTARTLLLLRVASLLIALAVLTGWIGLGRLRSPVPTAPSAIELDSIQRAGGSPSAGRRSRIVRGQPVTDMPRDDRVTS